MNIPGYKKRFSVEFYNTDFRSELKLSALFGMLQETAGPASEALGFGFRRMRESFNAAWILTRMRADVARPAAWGEEIVIETWNRNHSRTMFERDFIVWSADGERLASAVSKWVVLDIATRAMLSADDFGFGEKDIDIPRAIDCKLGRLRAPDALTDVYRRAVAYSDVDVNGHVNNARYVDFAMDSLPLEYHAENIVKSIEISYVSEARAGETLTLRSAAAPGVTYIEGVNGGAVVFRAQLTT
ncbi:MAG: acyl-ACP thioesterase, partial [Oscillospiraceae bacterium]|nr:acyl-ACP thioesterase [Oscillospiraceae bacterium]